MKLKLVSNKVHKLWKREILIKIKTKKTMKIDEQLAIMKAYINKIPIEVKHRLSTNKWKDLIYTNDYYFNFYEYEYRIKEEPEYRPYKTIEEAFNEAII